MIENREKRADLLVAVGGLYISQIFFGVYCAQSIQSVVSVERTVYYRESAAGMYSALPYALAQVLNLN